MRGVFATPTAPSLIAVQAIHGRSSGRAALRSAETGADGARRKPSTCDEAEVPYERLDFDQDGAVDMADFSLMQTSFTAL